MPPTINELKWSYLTGAVNEMKSPNQFLTKLLYRNRQTLPTEDIEIGLIEKDRETAPFVRKNGEGIMVGGRTEKFQTVSATNIRIKRPFTPSELLYNRRPGTVIFVNGREGERRAAIRDHINSDLQIMADMATNSIEWLVAQSLTGTIAYEVADQEVFQVTFPRHPDCSYSLTATRAWDAPDKTGILPLRDVHEVKRVFNEHTGLTPTDCILGINAANALLSLAESNSLPALKRDSGIAAGTISFVESFNDDGAIFLGVMGGIRFWEYSRTVNHNGSATSLIRDDYAEFISTSASSQRRLYFGAIPDMRAISGGRLGQMERFSKSWEEEDPSVMMALLASRPLPVPRRPSATVSVKTTNV